MIIKKNCFSPQSEPHTAKLCLSVVLKLFWVNSQRTSLFSQKVTLPETSMKYSESLYFSPSLKGAYPDESLNLFKKMFLIKPVKGDKY